MKKTSAILILVIAAAVNLSNGYSVIAPDTVKASFSGSSASSSAFAHSSSSSYTFDGPIDPSDLEKLKASAASVAAAGATAGAGAITGAGAVASTHAGAVAQAGSVSGAFAGSSSTTGVVSGHLGGAESGATSGTISGSDQGCTGGSGDCEGSQDHNQIGSSAAPVDTGAYKIINTNKYTTGYSAGSQEPNYAIAGPYVQEGSQKAGGGCSTCKGPFPGPNGSIHDHKPASSVPFKGHSSSEGMAHAAGSSSSYQPPKSSSNLPGTTNSVYLSKPAVDILPPAPSGTGYHGTAGTISHGTASYGSGSAHVAHVSPSLIATFPGPTGSIYDSKPVGLGINKGTGIGLGAGAGVGVGAGAGSHYSNTGPVSNSASPVDCKYTPGSTYKNCGVASSTSGFNSIGHSTGLQSILPGPSGSIYDSKPAPAHGTGAGAGAGAFAGAGASAEAVSHTGFGSISNIPSSYPAVPTCINTPGSPNKNCEGTTSSTSEAYPGLLGSSGSIYQSKPATSVSAFGAGSGAGTGFVSNIPSSHPIVGPSCSYTPGSLNYCGGKVPSTEQKVVPGSSASLAPNLPGPSGSIHSSKPASSVTSHAGTEANGESAAGVNAGSYYGDSGSVVSVPSSYPIAGSACSYNPSSPNYCGGTSTSTENKFIPGSSASLVPNLPGPSGNIYNSKPASSVISHGGAGSGANSESFTGAGTTTGSGSYSTSGSVSNIPSTHPVVGPICSYNPGSPNKCGSGNVIQNAGISGSSATAGAIAAAQAGSHLPAPSVHPEVPASHGTYYINKGTSPPKDIQTPSHSVHSFSGQIPCSDNTCGSEISNHAAGSSSGAYYDGQSKGIGGSHNVVFVDKDKSDVHTNINHDEAHQSGGLVFDNGDGSYSKNPKGDKPAYKNTGDGYAISTDEANNKDGFIYGPATGTAHTDIGAKPFGTDRLGSSNLIKTAPKENKNSFGTQGVFGSLGLVTSGGPDTKPFGTQGAFGGSAAFTKGSSSSENQFIDSRPCALGDCSSSNAYNKNGFATGDVKIQKVDGSLVSADNTESYKPANIPREKGHPVKLECTGASCGDTEVYIIEENPSQYKSHNSGSGCSSDFCGGSGSGSASGSGFATGQVLVQKGGGATYDVINNGANGNVFGGSYSGLNSDSHFGNQFGGCSTGQCGGHGIGVGASSGLDSSGGILNKLFGSGGLSGTLNKLGGNGFSGGGAYSNAGTYSSASAGGFASASASAHAGSFAHSF